MLVLLRQIRQSLTELLHLQLAGTQVEQDRQIVNQNGVAAAIRIVAAQLTPNILHQLLRECIDSVRGMQPLATESLSRYVAQHIDHIESLSQKDVGIVAKPHASVEIVLIMMLQADKQSACIRDAQPLTQYATDQETSIHIGLLTDVHESWQLLFVQPAGKQH